MKCENRGRLGESGGPAALGARDLRRERYLGYTERAKGILGLVDIRISITGMRAGSRLKRVDRRLHDKELPKDSFKRM